MQTKENIDTFLSQNDCWVIFNGGSEKWLCSEGVESIAASLGMSTTTLIPLLSKTGDGVWPAQIGGKLYKTASLPIGDTTRIVTIEPSNSAEIALLLGNNTGDEIFAVSSADGRIIAVSEQASTLMGKTENLSSMFDSSSSGAVQAALRKCVTHGFIPEFLARHTEENGDKSNYAVAMRMLPSASRMIFCRFSIPSVAVVAGTMDRNSLISVLLEESFCPNVTVGSGGLITSANPSAKELCMELWALDPTNTPFSELVHPDQRQAVVLRHEQRSKGYAAPSRYSVKLVPSTTGEACSADVSILPLYELDQWIVFIRPTVTSNAKGVETSGGILLPEGFQKLLDKESVTPEQILLKLVEILKAQAGAYVNERGKVTVGDPGELMGLLDNSTLAAGNTGFLTANTYHHRINSGLGVSHLVLQGMPEGELKPSNLEAIRIVSRILEGHQIHTVLRDERKMLALTKEVASAYLRKTETLDGLLTDFTKGSGVETAAVFRISKNGSFLQGIAGAGTVGDLPDLALEALNTASWACLRGEAAFYSESPENDLRFSRVFPESLWELAVPFFRGATPEGVILLASSELESFSHSAGEFVRLLALLFSLPESAGKRPLGNSGAEQSEQLRVLALDSLIHNITSLESASSTRANLLREDVGQNLEILKSVDSLLESVIWLGFHSKWALWFLKISLYGGKPEQKWIDPTPLLEKSLAEFSRFTGTKGIELKFNPPPSDIEVCTDGSFIGMIAHSLLVSVLENASGCNLIELAVGSKGDHWTFSLDSKGDSIPGECLSTQRSADRKNMSFVLAWKLTEELGGTVSTFSSQGKSTRIVIRLRVSG